MKDRPIKIRVRISHWSAGPRPVNSTLDHLKFKVAGPSGQLFFEKVIRKHSHFGKIVYSFKGLPMFVEL